MDFGAPLQLFFVLLVLLMIAAAHDDAKRHQAKKCGYDFLFSGHGLTSDATLVEGCMILLSSDGLSKTA
ncbi:MAG: hypothetical protein AAGA21_15770 [Pseudomonadota bacterium]